LKQKVLVADDGIDALDRMIHEVLPRWNQPWKQDEVEKVYGSKAISAERRQLSRSKASMEVRA